MTAAVRPDGPVPTALKVRLALSVTSVAAPLAARPLVATNQSVNQSSKQSFQIIKCAESLRFGIRLKTMYLKTSVFRVQCKQHNINRQERRESSVNK